MTRKIIQICTSGVENTQTTQSDFILTALCNDGTIWNRFGHQSNWLRIEDIPQDKLYRNDLELPATTEWRGCGQEKYEGRDIGDLK